LLLSQLCKGPSWVRAEPLTRPINTIRIFFHHRRWLLLRAVLAALVLGIRLTVPIMLRGYVKFLDAYDIGKKALAAVAGTGAAPAALPPPLLQGWLWAAGLVVCSLASVVLDATNTWNTQAHSNVLRMQLGAALSAKALRLGAAAMMAQFGAGRLLNAFSSDARRVSELNMLLEFLVSAPLITLVAYVMIALEAGWIAATASIAVYVFALPFVVSVVCRGRGCLGFQVWEFMCGLRQVIILSKYTPHPHPSPLLFPCPPLSLPNPVPVLPPHCKTPDQVSCSGR